MSRLGDGLSLLLIAFLADAAMSGIPGVREMLAAPLSSVRAIASALERRLNRERRSAGTRMVRGILVALFAAVAGWCLGLGAEDAIRVAGPEMRWLDALVLLLLISQRRPFDLARRVAAALGSGDKPRAAAALARLIGRDVAAPDEHAVARGAIEAQAAALSAGVVGVSLWYLAFGLPGAVLYRVMRETTIGMGAATVRGAAFGAASARFDALLGLVPGPVAGIVLSLAALFVPGANMTRALSVMGRDFGKIPASAAGWTIGAMAGALGLALAGPRPDGGAGGPWIGDGRARAGAADVRSAGYVFAVAALIHAGLLAAARLAIAAG